MTNATISAVYPLRGFVLTQTLLLFFNHTEFIASKSQKKTSTLRLAEVQYVFIPAGRCS